MEFHILIEEMSNDILKYIKNYDIHCLNSFLSGFIKKRVLDKTISEDERFFLENFKMDFSLWVAKYYQDKNRNKGWFGYILYHNKNSHKKALEEFFKLYGAWYEEIKGVNK